jgi:hypothetical protein
LFYRFVQLEVGLFFPSTPATLGPVIDLGKVGEVNETPNTPRSTLLSVRLVKGGAGALVILVTCALHK